MFVHAHRLLVPQGSTLTIQHESEAGYGLFVDIVCLTEQFRDFQMSILEEGLSQINELLTDESLLFEDAVHAVEVILQNTNEKLIDFAEKMHSVESFDIRGIISLTHYTSFVSAVIGEVSLALVRKGQLGYIMQNDSDVRQKISLFSDVIEGDLSRDDTLYFFGLHIQEVLEREDMDQVVVKSSRLSADEQLDQWENTLLDRVIASEVGVLVQYRLEQQQFHFVKTGSSRGGGLGFKMPQRWNNIGIKLSSLFASTQHNVRAKMRNREFVILGILAGIFLLFVLGSIISGWMKNTAANTINPDGTVTATLSIEDIKREIAAFQKLDPQSEEKGTKYNTLIEEIQRIKDQGKWVNDVEQLKKILDTEYLQGFKIVLYSDLSNLMVYDFSTLEDSTLGKPLQLFYNKGFYIAGTQGGILGGISSDIRGTAVRSIINDNFTTCSLNLLKNGIYCATAKNTIFHIAKAGTESLGGDVVFPGSIVGLATYGSANFYVLTQDGSYTKDNTYIVRYTNNLGSQNTFGGTNPLPLGGENAPIDFTNGFSSVSIDGTFLVWAKDKKTLYQLYRNPQDKVLSFREVTLKGGTNVGKGFSDDVKVMTTAASRYVYLYDRTNKHLSVYISTPAKNNTEFSNNYALEYVMRVDLSGLSPLPVDVIVDESDGKQSAYVLLPKGVAKIVLTDLIETLNKTQSQ